MYLLKFTIIFLVSFFLNCKQKEKNPKIEALKARLNNIPISDNKSENYFIKQAVKLAIEAAENDNYGVGAVLADNDGNIVSSGNNQVFKPYFKSDVHAEMNTISKFEDKMKGERNDLSGYTIYTSLEPCPMCMSRILMAGIGHIVYAADDDLGGMIHVVDNYLKNKTQLKEKGFNNIQALPEVWEVFYTKQHFRKSTCDDELKKLAMDAFIVNIEEIRASRK